jgi:protease I
MTYEGKRAVVLVDELYHEIEGWYPILRLREAGLDVKIVGPEAGKAYPSKCGYPAVTNLAARDISAEDFDCIVIPGGYAADHLRRYPEVVKLVADAMRQGKIVAAIGLVQSQVTRDRVKRGLPKRLSPPC